MPSLCWTVYAELATMFTDYSFFAVNIADEIDLCAVVLNKSSRNNNKNPHHRLLQFTIQRCRNVKCIIDLPMKDFVMMIVITIIRSHQPHGFSLLVAIHIFNTFNRWHSTYCFKSLAIRFELVIWKINKTLAFFTSLPVIFFFLSLTNRLPFCNRNTFEITFHILSLYGIFKH